MPLEASLPRESEAPDVIAQLISARAWDAALELSIKHHSEAIGRFCMAMLSVQADAEEATQETFAAAYTAFAQFRGESNVRGFLFGIARRQCARILEREARPRRFAHLIALPGSVDSPEVDLATHRQQQKLAHALSQLKPSERDAVLLHFQAGLSFREIAEACGIEEAAARKRASRGISQLRDLLHVEEL